MVQTQQPLPGEALPNDHQVVLTLAENLEVMIEISEKVRQQVGLGEGAGAPLGTDPSDDDPITLDD